MWLGEFELIRIPLLCEPVHNRTARIAEAHHLRAFVKGLSHSIINGLAKNFIFKRAVHSYDL